MDYSGASKNLGISEPMAWNSGNYSCAVYIVQDIQKIRKNSAAFEGNGIFLFYMCRLSGFGGITACKFIHLADDVCLLVSAQIWVHRNA